MTEEPLIECEKVGLDYFDSAPVRHVASETIRVTPEEIFAVLLDGPSWTKFVWAIEDVVWTSGFPLEVGSTRSVYMKGDLVGHEEFIAYEHGKRMAFRFNQVSKGSITAFAEDYQVTDLGDGTCRIDWVMAMGDRNKAGDTSSGVIANFRTAILGAFVRHTLKRFRRYVESKPALEGAV